MTHSRSCTKQKVLLIYSLQSDYIKYVLCCAYYGMRRAIAHSAAYSQQAVSTQPPHGHQYPASPVQGGGKGPKNGACCQLHLSTDPIFLPGSFLPLFPPYLLVLVHTFLILLFLCLLWPCRGCLNSLRGDIILISMHLTVEFAWLKTHPGSGTSPEQVN